MCLWPWTGGFEWGHVRKSEERNLRWLCGWGAVLAASSEAAPLQQIIGTFLACRVSCLARADRRVRRCRAVRPLR